MHSLRLFACALLALPAAAQEWVRLTTPHFELYTNAGEKRGREAVLYFEQVRNFFLQVSPSRKASEFPVRLIGFRNEKDYKPYRPNEVAFAYYAGSHKRDYIVMQSFSSEYFPVAVHEYMHLVLKHSGLKVPVWFNEGWADLFSTLKATGNKAMVGEMLPGRIQAFRTEKWIPLAELGKVGHDSPHYNEKSKAGMFYAESWALTHMLFLGREYRPKFAQFVGALVQAQDLEKALLETYSKPISFFENELRTYFNSSSLYASVFDIKLTKSEAEADASPVTPLQSDIVLADLLSATGRRDDARRAYVRIAAAGEGTAEVQEALGYLSWQSNDVQSARDHFRKAFELGTQDARLCYNLAMLDLNAGASPGSVAPFLERALALKPDYLDAALNLGVSKADAKDFDGALKALVRIKSIDDQRAFTLFSTLAYVYAQKSDAKEALAAAKKAQQWARSPLETSRAMEMLRYLDARTQSAQPPEPRPMTPEAHVAEARPRLARRSGAPDAKPDFQPPDPRDSNPYIQPGERIERIEGIARSLTCAGAAAVFTINAAGRQVNFEIRDPGQVLIKHSGQAAFEFTCGPQKPFKVAVEYAVTPDAGKDTAGIVKSLEF